MDGGVFEGNFTKGNLHGEGTYKGENVGTAAESQEDENGNPIPQGKNCYKGEWNHGMKHGKGVFTWADGSKYEGSFRDDLFHGQGEYKRADGKHYKGKHSLLNFEYSIFPARKFCNLEKPFGDHSLLGDWRRGVMHGKGEYVWPDGKKYTGGWKNGKMHGEGKMVVKGKTVKGTWVNGKLQKDTET